MLRLCCTFSQVITSGAESSSSLRSFKQRQVRSQLVGLQFSLMPGHRPHLQRAAYIGCSAGAYWRGSWVGTLQQVFERPDPRQRWAAETNWTSDQHLEAVPPPAGCPAQAVRTLLPVADQARSRPSCRRLGAAQPPPLRRWSPPGISLTAAAESWWRASEDLRVRRPAEDSFGD